MQTLKVLCGQTKYKSLLIGIGMGTWIRQCGVLRLLQNSQSVRLTAMSLAGCNISTSMILNAGKDLIKLYEKVASAVHYLISMSERCNCAANSCPLIDRYL